MGVEVDDADRSPTAKEIEIGPFPLSPPAKLLAPLTSTSSSKQRGDDMETMRINTADLNEIENEIKELVKEHQGGAVSGDDVGSTPLPAMPSIQSPRELKTV